MKIKITHTHTHTHTNTHTHTYYTIYTIANISVLNVSNFYEPDQTKISAVFQPYLTKYLNHFPL